MIWRWCDALTLSRIPDRPVAPLSLQALSLTLTLTLALTLIVTLTHTLTLALILYSEVSLLAAHCFLQVLAPFASHFLLFELPEMSDESGKVRSARRTSLRVVGRALGLWRGSGVSV